jgi:hypothetical protein
MLQLMPTLVCLFHGSLDLFSSHHNYRTWVMHGVWMDVKPLVHVTVSMATSMCNRQCPFRICGFEVSTSRLRQTLNIKWSCDTDIKCHITRSSGKDAISTTTPHLVRSIRMTHSDRSNQMVLWYQKSMSESPSHLMSQVINNRAGFENVLGIKY